MAKKDNDKKPTQEAPGYKEQLLFNDVKDHYDIAADETDKRRTGSGDVGRISFDEADELFRSWLDEDCVTPDTEVLTREGFKKIPEVTEEDEVLSLNPDTGFAEYVSDCGLAVHDHDGPMVHFNGRSIDMMTNYVHRMWAGDRYGHNPDYEDFDFKLSLTFLDRSSDHVAFNNKIRYKGKNADKWNIPELKSKKDYIAKLNHKFDALDFAEFMGWYLSEGSCEVTKKNKNGNSYYRVTISQKKPQNVKNICGLIKRLGFKPHINGRNITFSAYTLAHWLKQFGHARDKFIPRDLLEAQAPVRQVLLETLLRGDGRWNSDTRWRYTTLSKQLADDVQELALKTGYYASIANSQKTKNGDTIYRVCGSVSKTGNIYAKEFKEENYKGKIYSLYMPKNHIYFARRNGKCVWTGNSWPYDALLFDPRTFTFIFEKTARLISKKLRGRLIPREGGDVLGAHVNNELLSFQWDQATHGGSMIKKWSLMDINARKYGASFGLCKWRYEVNSDDEAVFDGPELEVLNNRDCLPDPAATSIESCNWFQVRKFVTFQELERINDEARSKPVYKNLDRLREVIGQESQEGGDTRSTRWTSRNRQISQLTEDPYGRDAVFKTVEVVTEYRKDKWITFSPRHGVILREIDNPYENHELPIVMLRYYPIDDDLYGMSEIEPIKGPQKAINAILSQYVDEINQKLYSPIAVGPGVRQHTMRWGKGARWQMTNPMTDFRVVESKSNAAQYFNNTYSVLVSAMMNALGESSLGVSNIDAYNPDKTATEVRALVKQQSARDNYNQIYLSEALKRLMKLWYSMNQKMLFNSPEKKNMVVRIVGHEAIKYFKEAGLDADIVGNEALELLQDRTTMAAMENRSEEVKKTMDPEQFVMPKFPVETGEGEFKHKFELDETGRVGELIVEATDLKGEYDYAPDVESMALAGGDKEKEGRSQAVAILLSNRNVIDLLAKEGIQPKFKELFITWLRDLGFKDADRYFEELPEDKKAGMAQAEQQQMWQQMQQAAQQNPQVQQMMQQAGPQIQEQMRQQSAGNAGGMAGGQIGGVQGQMFGSMGGEPGRTGYQAPQMPGQIVGGAQGGR